MTDGQKYTQMPKDFYSCLFILISLLKLGGTSILYLDEFHFPMNLVEDQSKNSNMQKRSLENNNEARYWRKSKGVQKTVKTISRSIKQTAKQWG